MICPSCKEPFAMVYIGGAVGMGIPLYACKKCGAVATESDKVKNCLLLP